MSLLEGRHTVEVTPLTQGDDYDAPTQEGAPVTWRCNVHPLSAELASSTGYDFTTTVRIAGRGWPGGSMARVLVLDGPWPGRTFETVGQPKQHRMSPTTAHDVVYAKGVGAEWQE